MQSQGIRQNLADEARDRNALDEIRSSLLDRAANEMPDLQRDRVIEPHPCSNHRDQLGGGMLSEYDPCGVAGNEMDGERQQNGRQQHDDERGRKPSEDIARHGRSSRTYAGLKYWTIGLPFGSKAPSMPARVTALVN